MKNNLENKKKNIYLHNKPTHLLVLKLKDQL